MLQILCTNINGEGEKLPLCTCAEHECKYVIHSHIKLVLTDTAFDYVCKPWGVVGRRSDCITITILNSGLINAYIIELKNIEKLKRESKNIGYLVKSIEEKIRNSIRCIETLTRSKYAINPVVVIAFPASDLEVRGRTVFNKFLSMLVAGIKNSVCSSYKSAIIIIYDCKYLFEYRTARCVG